MLLLRIELSNFRQYKDVDIYFPRNGLVGIRGDNGAGKSTLFNSMDWILYGKYKGKITQSQLKTFGAPAKSQTFGVLDFVYQDDFYRVRRDVASSSSKNFVQKNNITVAAGTTNVNEYIKELFKMDQESFRTCYYASQDDFDALAKLNSAPRVQMVSKLLRLETIDSAAEKARKDKKVFEIEIQEAKRHLKNEDELLNSLEETKEEQKDIGTEIKRLEKEIDTLEKTRGELTFTKEQSDKVFEAFQEYSSLISNLETKKQTLHDHSLNASTQQLHALFQKKERYDSISHQKEYYFSLLKRKDDLNDAKEQFLAVHRLEKQKQDAMSSLQSVEQALFEVEKSLLAFNQIETQVKAIEQSIFDKEQSVGALRDKAQQLQTMLNVNKNKYQEIVEEKNNFEQLGSDIPCPTCKRPLGEHQEEHLKHLEEKKKQIVSETAKMKLNFDTIISQGSQEKAQLDELKNSLRLLQQKLSQKSGYLAKRDNSFSEKQKLENSLSELSLQRKEFPDKVDFDTDSYKALIEEIKSLIPIYEEIIKLENIVNDIPDVEKTIESLKLQIEELSTKIQISNQERENLGFDRDTHYSLSNQIEELRNRIDSIKGNKYTLQSRSEVVKNNLNSLKKMIKENEQKRDALKEKQELIVKLTKIDQLFKTYKTDKLSKLSPTLSDIMSDMMDIITDGRYDRVELDDQYNIFIYRNGEKHPLDIFSGGEQKLAALCQRIAISQLLVSQTGQANFDMIALDEVFGSMDAKRQDSMIDMFRNLNDMFAQILIVSHSENVKDMFDHTLHIEFDGKHSTSKWIKDEYGRPTWDEDEVREYIAKNFDLEEDISDEELN